MTDLNQKYTQAEMKALITSMEMISDNFYKMCYHAGIGGGNHAFIEFTGLMNEYIKICRNAMAQGIEFPRANIHNGIKLPIAGYELEYIREKLDCIFQGALKVDIRKD